MVRDTHPIIGMERDAQGHIVRVGDPRELPRESVMHFELDRRLAKLPQPVDRDEWELPAHIVNAYYHPTLNEIVVSTLVSPLCRSSIASAVSPTRFCASSVRVFGSAHPYDALKATLVNDIALRAWACPVDPRARARPSANASFC